MEAQHVLAALDLLKDWSNSLLVVQSGALAVIGALVKESRSRKTRLFALCSVACFVISICAAANLLGSLPYLAQKADVVSSIYREEGNLNIPISYSATAQVIFFVCGLVAFILFAWSRTGREGTSQNGGLL
ncbi:MAG TPA: hypothetical protein VGX03_35725 [Candidatus Binatia bacterium]|jgi:hypothetical protein|nr:hypothetical protein [Candidatus Binatia bacterium]